MKQYIEKFDDKAGTEEAVFPLPEPSDIHKASLINFDSINTEISNAADSLKGTKIRGFIINNVGLVYVEEVHFLNVLMN